MHELPLTKSIFKSVVTKADGVGAKSVRKVVLEIGVLRDFVPEIVQRYWDYITPGSVAEGSVVEIKELGASARCGRCESVYPIVKDRLTEARCPLCGYEYGTLVSGRELRILGIEVEFDKKQKEQ